MATKPKKKKSILKNYRLYVFLLLLASILVFAGLVLFPPLIPTKYKAITAVISIVLLFVFFKLLFNKRTNTVTHALSSVLIIMICAFLGLGSFYLVRSHNFLDNITFGVDKVSIIVLEDSNLKELDDLNGKVLGTPSFINKKLEVSTIKAIDAKTVTPPTYKNYTDWKVLINDLYTSQNIDGFILNETAREEIENQFPDFKEKTRVLFTFEIKRETLVNAKEVAITKEPFNIFVSGLDTFGDTSNTSRSDVNMIISVNPVTKQILMISIPRDYYMPLTCEGNQSDKLTHSGIEGIDCTMSSLENFFDIDLNYYAQLNFTGLINIIDALGGIEVEIDNSFMISDGYYYQSGKRTLSGARALAYIRDREHQVDGDRARGRHQMDVIKAIIGKLMSPSIMAKYDSLLKAIENDLSTNLSKNEISGLISMQLDDMKSWTITPYSVNGSDGEEFSPALGFYAYMMIPDMETVEIAKQKLELVHSGQDASKEPTEEKP